MNNEEIIRKVTELLTEAQSLITKDAPDMDVAEWNQTNQGKAVSRIHDALELIEELD